MNRHPLAPITDDLKEHYERDGVVCLRGMFDQEWITRLRIAAEAVVEAPAEHGGIGYSHGPMTAVNLLYSRPSVFRDFVFDSPVGEIIGRIIGSGRIRMYHDYVFSKQPGSGKVIPWHTDGRGYSVEGMDMPNMWIALTPTDHTNGRLEFAAGYHKTLVERLDLRMDAVATNALPDFEAEFDTPDFPYRRLAWDLEPGDAVLFHPYAPHHSKPNVSVDKVRTGYAVRVIGDDVVWAKKHSTWLKIPGLDFDTVEDGAPVVEDALPLIWQGA